jgi:hypothetical protein
LVVGHVAKFPFWWPNNAVWPIVVAELTGGVGHGTAGQRLFTSWAR